MEQIALCSINSKNEIDGDIATGNGYSPTANKCDEEILVAAKPAFVGKKNCFIGLQLQ